MPKPEVAKELAKYVLVRLYVDPGPHASPEEAEKNYGYEADVFKKLVQPIYGIIDADGKIVAHTDYNTAKSVDDFASWLRANAESGSGAQ